MLCLSRLYKSRYVLTLAVAAAIAGGSMGDADAAKRRTSSWQAGKYAAIVIDANTDKVLFANNAEKARYPASLTKMMTLYVLFDDLAADKLRKTTKMSASARAVGQPPSKLGLKPGQTITVDQAIRALVTKSANDVAVTIAEHIAGSEQAFARRMTETARRLGMTDTTFRNASGLPDADQRTTAKDMSILARALQRDHEAYYDYFSARSFTFNGRTYANHNRLLGRVNGVDGIKTGYIRASGFNLTTSAKRGKRHLVAVVMGGPSGRLRDDRMASLLETYFPKASTTKSFKAPAPKPELIARVPVPSPRPIMAAAEAADDPIAALAAKPLVLTPKVIDRPQTPALAASTVIAPTLVASTQAAPTQTGPIKTSNVSLPAKFGGRVPAASSLAPRTLGEQQNALLNAPAAPAGSTQPVTVVHRQPGTRRLLIRAVDNAAPPASPATGPATGLAAAAQTAAAPIPQPVDTAAPGAKVNDTVAELISQQLQDFWLIQIGAFDEETAAREKLRQAQEEAKALKARLAYTEPIKKDQLTLYRARFMGFDRNSAQAACNELKKAKFKCLAIKQ